MHLLYIVVCLVIYVECKNITDSFKKKELVDTINYFKNIGKFNKDSDLNSQKFGKFIGSTLGGPKSNVVPCTYELQNAEDKTVTLLCPKEAGCCVYGCCLKPGASDWYKYLKQILDKVIHEESESKSIKNNKVENKLT
uniref:Uncharacterized protein n=1 Tax=Acrobeloides nanus TaxID=290746 RepID=A0A914DAC5_9BILA